MSLNRSAEPDDRGAAGRRASRSDGGAGRRRRRARRRCSRSSSARSYRGDDGPRRAVDDASAGARSSGSSARTGRGRRPRSSSCSGSSGRRGGEAMVLGAPPATARRGGGSATSRSCSASRAGSRPPRSLTLALPPDPAPPRRRSRARSTTRSRPSGSPIAATTRSAPSRRGCSSGSASPSPCSAEPELVILDEPTSALDPVGRHDVRGIIRGVRERGADGVLEHPPARGGRARLRPGVRDRPGPVDRDRRARRPPRRHVERADQGVGTGDDGWSARSAGSARSSATASG